MSIIAAAKLVGLAKGFIPKNWQQVINMIAIGGLCLAVGHCKGESSANAKHDAARVLANVKALGIDAGAKATAANERVNDALRIERNEEELIDAISEIPDTTPSPVRVMLACKRLRSQGTPAADIPAVCGPKGSDSP